MARITIWRIVTWLSSPGFSIMSPPNDTFSFAATYQDCNSNTIRYDSILPHHNQGSATWLLPFPGSSRCHALLWIQGSLSCSCGIWFGNAYRGLLACGRGRSGIHNRTVQVLSQLGRNVLSWKHNTCRVAGSRRSMSSWILSCSGQSSSRGNWSILRSSYRRERLVLHSFAIFYHER